MRVQWVLDWRINGFLMKFTMDRNVIYTTIYTTYIIGLDDLMGFDGA
jgi:hypothetical protein